MEIEDLYSQLLGIELPWKISDVDLKTQEQRTDIDIEHIDDIGFCPEYRP